MPTPSFRAPTAQFRVLFTGFARPFLVSLSLVLTLVSCESHPADQAPSIEFSRVPPTGDGSPDRLETIEGRVKGAHPGQRIVLFALSGVWWVQPFTNQPFAEIRKDSTWTSLTHPGAAYAALLVESHYRPPLTINALPQKGGLVLAVNSVQSQKEEFTPKRIQFSGYQWDVLNKGAEPKNGIQSRSTATSDSAGLDNRNTWIDHRGFLHLRVTRQGRHWLTAGVKLSRSLGFGSYRFVVSDISQFEPSAVLALFTYDYLGPAREMDVEISRWGEPEDKNAQFVVQPYIIPANTVRFEAPRGPLTQWIDWQPERVSFRTVRGSTSNRQSAAIAEHVFTSGVPSAGNERIHLNLWQYGNTRRPLLREFEVVIEKFEFLP